MSDENSITGWISKLKAGDHEAAWKVWEQYADNLLRLARKKLRGATRRAADEEDVVLSAVQSFCTAAAEGNFSRLHDREDLWQLLVVITTRKAADLIKYERRVKRGNGKVRGESVFLNRNNVVDRRGIEQIIDAEPTPEIAALFTEEFERLLGLLDKPELRQIALAKLDGHSNAEIAAILNFSIRSVERKLLLIRTLWSQVTPHD